MCETKQLCVCHERERKRNTPDRFSSPHESVNRNIYVKELEGNLLHVSMNRKMCPWHPGRVVLPEFVLTSALKREHPRGNRAISRTHRVSPVPALSPAMIGIKPASFFLLLEYLVGTFEAQKDILRFSSNLGNQRKPKCSQPDLSTEPQQL